jgi:hypothetical protein
MGQAVRGETIVAAARVRRPRPSRGYSCLVVVIERVVVVPPSGSVAVIVWLSVLPATPSR